MLDKSSLASGDTLLSLWSVLSRVPGGRRVFSKLIGQLAPYTGTIDARVVTLERGFARVEMRDRRAVRNHLRSIHAIALVNLAEVSTGLAMMSGLPSDGRGILKGIAMEYLKKGRGTLTAECRCDVPDTSERRVYEVQGRIRDASGDLVARATAEWLIGPKKASRRGAPRAASSSNARR